VGVDEVDSAFVISEVEERTHQVVRQGPGGRGARVVAANIDTLVAVVAAKAPDPRTESIDLLLALAEADRLDAVLVLNKLDLDGAREQAGTLAELYRRVGYPVYEVSAQTGEGMEDLAVVLRRGTSVLVGSSGAGKSSLLNALEPGLALSTGELSRRGDRGRHTTVSARLIPLSGGGTVADTPGFEDVRVWGLDASELPHCFPEFRPLDACRFRNCSHIHEPDCAVRAAVANGTVAASRYESYLSIRSAVLEG
jgi:ribosome biogenesis GTPase